MKFVFVIAFTLLYSMGAYAITAPLNISITGAKFDVSKTTDLSDIGEGANDVNFDFKNADGEQYNFDLKYVALPSNRSYPTNLDITVTDKKGDKLGYLFWANNGIEALQGIGVFGIVVDIDGEPVDFRFTFDKKMNGELSVAELEDERFVQDTLVSKLGFQMIRPVVMPLVSKGVRSQTYALDDLEYAVNYTAKDIEHGLVEFQYNFYRAQDDEQHCKTCLLPGVRSNAAKSKLIAATRWRCLIELKATPRSPQRLSFATFI